MDHEEIRLELIQEGVLDLFDGEPPKAIEHKLEALSMTACKPNLSSDRPKDRPKLALVAPKKQASSVPL